MKAASHIRLAASPELRDEAVEWLVKLRGEDGDALRPAFDTWLEHSPEHRAAYAWAQSHFCGSARLHASQRHGPNRHARQRQWMALAAALILTFTASILISMQFQHYAEPARIIVRTGPGEMRTYDLGAGSKVFLDADSQVEVIKSGDKRRIVLRQGQARLFIARAAKPFLAEAGDGTVRSHGGVFDIGYRDPGHVFVALISGTASLFAKPNSMAYAPPATSLVAGRPLTYTARNFLTAASREQGIDRSDWPEGWIDFRAIPLREVAAQANRYSARPIVLADGQIGELKVSGRFRITNTQRIATRLGEVFDLEVDPRSDGIHLSGK